MQSTQLEDRRNDYEDGLLVALSHMIPTDLRVTVLADRGFGDVALYDRQDNVELTQSRQRTEAVFTVRDTDMKEPWFLATSRPDRAEDVVTLYSRRFTIVLTFRDTKDPHFGMGISQPPIGRPDRRDLSHAVLDLLRGHPLQTETWAWI